MGDFNIELGLLCAGADEKKELAQLSVCLCWRMYKADPRGLNKLMWYSVMKESDCRVTCKRSCDDEQGERLHASAVEQGWAQVAAGLRAATQNGVLLSVFSSTSTSSAVRGIIIWCKRSLRKKMEMKRIFNKKEEKQEKLDGVVSER